MTITPRRPPSRSGRARTIRPAAPSPAHTARPAPTRARARHAAEPAALPEVAAPAPVDGGRKGTRRAPRSYLGAAVLRCALYLGPLSVAVAGGESLGQVPWPVPLATLLLGWSAAQALTFAGVTVARRAGVAAGCRLVGAGFTAVGALWCALVWIAPDALLGPERWLALVVGLGGLATLATVTAALVTRAEAAVVGWCVPCWALAAAALAALNGHPVPSVPIGRLLPDAILVAGHPMPPLPIGTLLPAAIVVALVRAFRPAMICGSRRPIRLTRPQLRRAAAYLVIGASQAISVGLVWRAGPSGSTAPFWLPLLLAVPILEALIGWSTEAGPRRRGVATVTLAGLLPPLALGVALALVAARTEARAEVLALAAGTLLGGVFAVTYLLAARGRTGIAATVAIAAPLLTVALKIIPLTVTLKILPLTATGPLPDAVGALAVTHLAGLLAVALTAADHRRTS
ncbi:hypothetical protein ODJ79_08085 [Actinoplanes sp. KI2]|uniref:hypothetical protein n=1 Tax=Actinoplanes sp. KI2 TaxID=2983315 RepID=UPI0021D60613|nr:hypothetical protein [Actinoplanes sp. KI2]MCU7723667.1 hypothetical protein [Actinoplanes sp. KI2]